MTLEALQTTLTFSAFSRVGEDHERSRPLERDPREPVASLVLKDCGRLRAAPADDEVRRRLVVLNEILKLRDALPPLEISAGELIRRARQDNE